MSSPQCSCIAGSFDAFIKAISQTKLVFKDASDWMDETNYSNPTSYEVTITPPGTTKTYIKTLLVDSDNIITIGDDKLKSGIYCFEVDSCGVHYTKSVALFPNLECCIKQAWATLDTDKHDKIKEIESYLKTAAINAEFNNVKAAAQNLDLATKLLRNLKCDCNC